MPRKGESHYMITTAQPLTISEADEAVLFACHRSYGAIEDCEESPEQVRYFFESGAVGIVDRLTGAVTIKAAANMRVSTFSPDGCHCGIRSCFPGSSDASLSLIHRAALR